MVDGPSQWELWLAPWVTLWRTVRGPVLRLEKVLQTPSLGGVRVAEPPLESLLLIPHLQKEHPHGQVQLLMLPLRTGEAALTCRRGNRNYLSTGLGSCALVSWVYFCLPRFWSLLPPPYTHPATNLPGYQLVTVTSSFSDVAQPIAYVSWSVKS